MSETARFHETELSTRGPGRPPLEVVRSDDTVDEEPAIVAEPNVGRSAMVGYVVGFFVVSIAMTVLGMVLGLSLGAALGLGAFVGIWGGGGFGFMMGGTVPLARYLDAQSARSNHHGQGDAR